jgi:hypothetical protein
MVSCWFVLRAVVAFPYSRAGLSTLYLFFAFLPCFWSFFGAARILDFTVGVTAVLIAG